MQWQPHVTVATIVERDNKFLLVEEYSNGKLVYNQPAGHLEPDESLEQAAIRETLEETGWQIQLQGLVGVALYQSPSNLITYHRTTFFAEALNHNPLQTLDKGITRALWLSYEEIKAQPDKLRSSLVLSAIEQYRNGHKYPLEFIYR